eukprot:2339719-Pyramimonas_sp.AAC.1
MQGRSPDGASAAGAWIMISGGSAGGARPSRAAASAARCDGRRSAVHRAVDETAGARGLWTS